jgi:hypothetical protein
LAIAEFAEALLTIPKTLVVNAAHDATELVAKLRAHHHRAQTDTTKKDYRMYVCLLWIPYSHHSGMVLIYIMEELSIIWNKEYWNLQ